MRLYHFTAAAHALSNIREKRIKIAQIRDLNDPFELRAPQFKTRDERRAWEGWRSDMDRRFGFVCFSRHWTNVAMWSHYADKHRGICLGFDIADGIAKEVEYTPARREFPLLPLPSVNDMQAQLFLKSTDWEYEAEWRAWADLNEPTLVDGQSLYFLPFDSNFQLAEVIVGPACLVKRAEIERLTLNYQERPRLLKARLAFGSFKVTKQRLGLK